MTSSRKLAKRKWSAAGQQTGQQDGQTRKWTCGVNKERGQNNLPGHGCCCGWQPKLLPTKPHQSKSQLVWSQLSAKPLGLGFCSAFPHPFLFSALDSQLTVQKRVHWPSYTFFGAAHFWVQPTQSNFGSQATKASILRLCGVKMAAAVRLRWSRD
jgi:hypothetical protein